MRCAGVRRRLGRHLEGELGEARRRRLAAHLEGCAACRDELEALRRTVELVRSLEDPALTADPAGRALARLREQAQPRPGAWRVAPGAARGAGLAAAGALVLGGTLLLFTGPLGPPEEPTAPLVDSGRAPELGFGPRVGAHQAPDPERAPDAATLEAWLHRLREEPEAFLRAWVQVGPDARERLGARLAERARARGEGQELAEVLRATGHPEAKALAERLTPPAD